MRLLVESLDASGKAIDTTSSFVADVPAGGRVYFEAPVKRKAARYRVTITGWDWRDGGGPKWAGSTAFPRVPAAARASPPSRGRRGPGPPRRERARPVSAR